MDNNSPSIRTLHNLLDYEACKFTIAEIQLKNKLPEWISMANSIRLKDVLLKYLDFVQLHIKKLDTVIIAENINSLSNEHRVMQAFIDDAGEKLSYCSDAVVKDACLLACIQEINHYKISTYGTAAAFSNTLGMEETTALFHEAEINEKQIDIRLSQLAEYEINQKAKSPYELHS